MSDRPRALSMKGASHSAAVAASAASDRSGHSSPSALRRKATRARNCCRRALHGSRSIPPAASASASARAVSGPGSSAQIARLQRQRAEAARFAGAQGGPFLVEDDLAPLFDAVGEQALDLGQFEAGGRQNARLRRASGRFGHGQIRRARQPVVRLDRGRPPVRHQEFAGLAAPLRDALGKGQRDQGAGR